MGVGGPRHAPAALTPGKRPGTHCIGAWVDPRAGLDGCGKSRPPPGFDPRTVQPVASRYTDWAIPAPSDMVKKSKNCKNGNRNPVKEPAARHYDGTRNPGRMHLRH
jgi:hypothetical protein